MAAVGTAARLVARLESRAARSVAGEDTATLAFSGGLGSLLAAALARKRCDLRCRTVGTDNAPDVERARALSGHLDYRVEVVPLTVGDALRRARGIAARHPRWPDGRVLDAAVLSAASDGVAGRLLVGFAAPLRSARVVLSPGTASRAQLLAAARVLGIPDGFARTAHRPPSVGSGVGAAIAARAREERTTVPRLLRSGNAPRSGP